MWMHVCKYLKVMDKFNDLQVLKVVDKLMIYRCWRLHELEKSKSFWRFYNIVLIPFNLDIPTPI
jgi:hypothetical protein